MVQVDTTTVSRQPTYVQGRVGEAAVMLYFTEAGYDVFLPAYGNSVYDMIVSKDGHVKTVQVKTTDKKVPSGNYEVQLRKVRSNKTANVVTKFDSTGLDYLAVYIVPTDTTMIYDAKAYEGRSTMTAP